MESMWNMWNPHGFHGRNCGGFHPIPPGFHGIFKFHGVSIWNEHGNLHQNGWALSQTNSIWNPWNPHGIGIHSTWNPPGMWGHSKDLTFHMGADLVEPESALDHVPKILHTDLADLGDLLPDPPNVISMCQYYVCVLLEKTSQAK